MHILFIPPSGKGPKLGTCLPWSITPGDTSHRNTWSGSHSVSPSSSSSRLTSFIHTKGPGPQAAAHKLPAQEYSRSYSHLDSERRRSKKWGKRNRDSESVEGRVHIFSVEELGNSRQNDEPNRTHLAGQLDSWEPWRGVWLHSDGPEEADGAVPGNDAVDQINIHYGGVTSLCSRLQTNPVEGKGHARELGIGGRAARVKINCSVSF